MSEDRRDKTTRTSPEKGDRVAELIRLAGARPTASAERTARVNQAVREHWEESVSWHIHRRRWMVAGLAAAAVLAVVVGLGVGRQTTSVALPRVAQVEAVTGTVWHTEPDVHPPSVLNTAGILWGDSALDSGASGRASVRMASGHSVRLDRDTRVRFLSGTSLVLERGAVYVDSGAAGAESPIEVQTPLGVLRDIGTQYEARVEGDTVRVRVREGRVEVDSPLGLHTVDVGRELELADGAEPVWRSRSPFDPVWGWAAGAGPRMAIEGRLLGEFLEWVSREGGWTVEYADAALAGSARDIVLNGSIDGLRLEDALAAVLPTCRMTHRIDEGVLRISAEAVPGG